MSRNLMVFAALLYKRTQPRRPWMKNEVIFHLHRNSGSHARKRVCHQRDERPVTQPHHRTCIYAVEQEADFI